MLTAPPREVGKAVPAAVGRWPGFCGEDGVSQALALRSKRLKNVYSVKQ